MHSLRTRGGGEARSETREFSCCLLGLFATGLALWPATLFLAALMFLTLDEQLTAREGQVIGVVQATLVVGVPCASVVAGCLTNRDFGLRSTLRLVLSVLAVAACGVAWIKIVSFWISMTPTPI